MPNRHRPKPLLGLARALALPLALAPVALGGCDELLQDDAPPKVAEEHADVVDDDPPAKAVKEAPPPNKADPVDAHLVSTTGAGASTPAVTPLPPGAKTADERNTIDVFSAAAPATVFVTQNRIVVDRFSARATEVPAGTGTGFIWDSAGHIVTNCHVALPDCQVPRSGKPKLEVTLYDKSTHPAEVVGHDSAKDIAVLKINASSAKLVPVRRPSEGYTLEVGQKTIAIGNPFGLDHTLTTGVVSALGREVRGVGGLTIRGMVQTDAAINPGNSGGPLLDSAGQLMGMNTMIFSSSGSSAGIGFAVPVTTIARLVPQLIRSGRPERVGIGVAVFNDRENARFFRVDGVVIRSFDKGSPAFDAGIRQPKELAGGKYSFDAIVGVDGERIRNFDDLYGSLETKKAGDEIKLELRRMPEDKVVTADIKLIPLVPK